MTPAIAEPRPDLEREARRHGIAGSRLRNALRKPGRGTGLAAPMIMVRLAKLVAALASLAAIACGAAPDGDRLDVRTAGQSVPLRFDVTRGECADEQPSCPKDAESCLCDAEIGALNYAKNRHWMAMAEANHRQSARANGNEVAAFDDAFAADPEEATADATAEAIASRLEDAFAGTPSYVVLGGLTEETWTARHAFVADVARALRETWQIVPIVCSPIASPENGEGWPELSRWAYIAADAHVTGQAVRAADFDVEAVRAMYRATLDAYAKVGVPRGRLFLLESYASTTDAEPHGRTGLGRADWTRAIHARLEASSTLGFGGYASYGWATNSMHDASDDRIGFVKAYGEHALP